MIKIFIIILLLIIPATSQAKVWDFTCGMAITDLSDSQEKIYRLKNDLNFQESQVTLYRSFYNSCRPTNYHSCQSDLDLLNIEIEKYNNILNNLKREMSNFDSKVNYFKIVCLE